MTDLPAPLVSAETDLTDFGFMPLDVRRLRDSRIASSSDGDEFRAAVLLWCAAWHQKPAASLPDDDIELSQLAGYGRVVREWKKVREGALHGWIKCSDGRLYHPVIAEKANEAWAGKLEHAWVRECDRLRKENKRREKTGEPQLGIPEKPLRNSGKPVAGIPTEKESIPAECQEKTLLKGEGEGKGSSLRSDPKRASEDEFEKTFWPKFPNKVGRPAALKAFLSARKRIELTAIMAGLERYIRDKPPDRAWLNPATFLNQERWDDKPAPPLLPGLTNGNGAHQPQAPSWPARARYFAREGRWRDEWGDRKDIPPEFVPLFEPSAIVGRHD